MKKKKVLPKHGASVLRLALLILFLCAKTSVCSQNIRGDVIDEVGSPIPGALVRWIGSSEGVQTDENGEFRIPFDSSQKLLIASFVSRIPDTLTVSDSTRVRFRLKAIRNLDEVVIRGTREGVIISDSDPIKTEQITQTELHKAACCDLAGCFETQTTVQPQTTNVLTNSKELRILGLSGVYNQVLLDGFPMIQGLTYTYGISSIPGTLIDNIYVSKGANSVLQGYESISGQINIETKEPDQNERLLLNAYLNSFSEKHFNANYTIKEASWSNLLSIHMIQPATRTDRDNDYFLDLPLLTRYMVFNKWKYGNEEADGWNSRIGLRFLNEQRIGGQIGFDPDRDKGSTGIYGQSVNIDQPEFWTKTGYRINENNNVVLFASTFGQRQESYFGSLKYQAGQYNFYGNLQYELRYNSHDLKTGLSYRFLNISETISMTDTFLLRTYAGEYKRMERIPGWFTENSMRFFDEKLTWIAGVRIDYHNQFGVKVTPRTLLKYDIAPRTVLRANVGLGWRNVNFFSENIGLLSSSRNVVFSETLDPEEALNFGFNFTHKFETDDDELSGYFSLDYYRTDFQNQIFPDYDSDATKAIVGNFTGKSVSNGFQAECDLKLLEIFEIKAGYNFLDVFRVEDGTRQLLPFNPRHKVLLTFSYKPFSEVFHFDMNLHWYGRQRLPDTQTNPTEYRRPDFSDPYTMVNAQFTYDLRFLEIYTGCENIFDFRQLQPIISWQNPFGPYFDTSSVWGPTRGRELYIGIRFKLNQE